MHFTSPASRMSSSLAVGLAALALLTLLFHYRRLRGHQLQLPPGPKGLPLIGNLLEFPQDDVAEYFATESLQKYGEPDRDFSLRAFQVLF